MAIIDSQVHAYEANTPKRPWHSVPNWPAHVTGDEMVAAMDKVGVDGAIFISAFSMYRYDASYAVEVQRAHPDRMAIVKPVDPDDPAVADVIADWKRTPGAVGIRIMMTKEAKRDPNDPGLDRIARASLALRPRPLFVGSAGLARALARTLPRKRPAPRPAVARRPVVTVVGSASAVSAIQARRLARDPSNILVQMAWQREPAPRDIAAVRRLGRLVAQAAPRVHYVLTGGETAGTEYFRRTTSQQLHQRFLPIVKKSTAKVGVAQTYNRYAQQGAAFGLVKQEQADLDEYVTQKALDGLYFMVAEEERKIRKDPVGTASNILKKVFGALL